MRTCHPLDLDPLCHITLLVLTLMNPRMTILSLEIMEPDPFLTVILLVADLLVAAQLLVAQLMVDLLLMFPRDTILTVAEPLLDAEVMDTVLRHHLDRTLHPCQILYHLQAPSWLEDHVLRPISNPLRTVVTPCRDCKDCRAHCRVWVMAQGCRGLLAWTGSLEPGERSTRYSDLMGL